MGQSGHKVPRSATEVEVDSEQDINAAVLYKMLRLSAKGGNLAGVRKVVAQLASGGSAFDLNIADTNGWSALHYAASKGHAAIVRFLMTRGASVYLRTTSRQTPLILAAQGGHMDVVECLVEEGHAQLFSASDAGTALEVAEVNNHDKVAEYLRGGEEVLTQKIHDTLLRDLPSGDSIQSDDRIINLTLEYVWS